MAPLLAVVAGLALADGADRLPGEPAALYPPQEDRHTRLIREGTTQVRLREALRDLSRDELNREVSKGLLADPVRVRELGQRFAVHE